MTVVLAPPVAAPRQGPVARRSRAGVAAAVVLVVLGLVWSGLLLWAPSGVDLSAGATEFGGSAEVVTVPEYGPLGTEIVDYRDGASVELTVPIRNDGPLPVTVTAASTGAGVLPLLEVQRVEGLPVRLAPGDTADLRLVTQLTNCAYYHEREVQNVRALLLDVDSGLGPVERVRTVRVPLARPLLVHSPMIVGCPDRKLNRQANDRRDAL